MTMLIASLIKRVATTFNDEGRLLIRLRVWFSERTLPATIMRWLCVISIGLLAAACTGSRKEIGSDGDREFAGPGLVTEEAFPDSIFRISIEGNDGPTPGDVLYVGQWSRLFGDVLAVGSGPEGEEGVIARRVDGARLRWRSLSPEVLGVDSLGHVRAVRPGRAAAEATAVFEMASPPKGVVRDTMRFEVLEPDTTLARFRVSEVSAPATSDAYQTCAVGANGEVACWRSPERPFGSDDEPQTLHVFAASSGRRLHRVVAGMSHVCALDDAGRAYCWGDNHWGQLGIGGKESRKVPTLVASADTFRKLSSGRSHTCGVTAKNELLCWGLGLNGTLGVSRTDRCEIRVERVPHRPEPEPAPCSLTPRPVQLSDGAMDVAAGDDHTCTLTTKQNLFCWGWVYSIDFGSGKPKRISDGGVKLVSIASGSRHVCGLDSAGHAYCWGRNWYGQLGAPVSKEGSNVLARVAGSHRYRAIVGGDDHTCAITLDGRALCWGRNFSGELGNGTRDDADRPILVASDLRWRALTAGFNHTCGTTEVGALYCWGSGLAFRLEPGSFHDQSEPFPVAGWQ